MRAVDPAEQPEVLARHIRDAAFRTLSAQRDPAKRVELVNAMLGLLDQLDDAASGDPRQLLSLSRPAAPGIATLSMIRPAIPLSDAALLTNAPNEPSLGAEIRAELETADQVDLLCAFVKWHGLRVLDAELKRASRTRQGRCGSSRPPTWARPSAERLIGWSNEFGAEVKIQYDAQRTRLHAKAWLFRRDTEFDTAYVGLVQPVPRRPAGRRGMERPAVPDRDPDADGEVRRHVRLLLERRHFRALRPRPGPRPAGRRAGRGLRAAQCRRADHLALRAGGSRLSVPGGDAGIPGGRTDRA